MGDSLFFVASKLFWLIARPESVLVALVLVAALWRSRAIGLFTVVAMLAIGTLPVSDWAIGPLERTYPVNPDIAAARGLIILGGASQEDISTAWESIAVNEHGERFLAALSVLENNPAMIGIFSGGSGSLDSTRPGEAAAAERILLSTGIDPARLQFEKTSRTTWENAVNTRNMIGKEAEQPWVLVTSAWHMPRSVEVFCAAGWPRIIPYPADHLSVPGRTVTDWRFAIRLQHLNLAVKEYVGLLAYRLSGRAAAPDCLEQAG